jgi:TolA-binding protein
MESNIAHTGQWYSVLGWLDKNRNQLIGAVAVVLLAAGVWWYAKCARDQKEVAAGESLSAVMLAANQTPVTAAALLKVAKDNAGTGAGGRALLAAAGQQFADGKPDDSLASFRSFLAEYDGSPLIPEAKLGVAACLQAQGKNAEAVAAYKEVVDRFGSANTVTPAKYALARIYESEGKLEQARDYYLELARNSQSVLGSEAINRLNDLIQKHPNLRPGAVAAVTNSTSIVPAK